MSGYPPWSRATGVGYYGASEGLHDYMHLGAPNVLDSVTAEQYAALAQAQAFISSTAPMFVLHVVAADPADPTVTALSMAGGSATYAGGSPPTGFPAVERVSNGEYTITVAADYADTDGEIGTFDPNFSGAVAVDSTYDTYANVVKVSSTELTLYHRDWSAGGTQAASKTSHVEIG